jgi:hypothetical protein
MAQHAVTAAPAWTSAQVVAVAGNLHGIVITLADKVYKGKTLGEHASENPAVLKTWAASRGSTQESQERKSFVQILIDCLEASQLMPMPPPMPVQPPAAVVPTAAAPRATPLLAAQDAHLRRRLITLPVSLPTLSAEMAKAAASTININPGLSYVLLGVGHRHHMVFPADNATTVAPGTAKANSMIQNEKLHGRINPSKGLCP